MSTAEYSYDFGTHYARRKVLAAKHGRGCRRNGVPECGAALKCVTCGKLVGACKGTSTSDECDPCWFARVERGRRTTHARSRSTSTGEK